MTSKKLLFHYQGIIITLYSEERTSSTHALTMYRHNTTVDGKEVKVGKLLFKKLNNEFDRYLGHSWIRIIQ